MVPKRNAVIDSKKPRSEAYAVPRYVPQIARPLIGLLLAWSPILCGPLKAPWLAAQESAGRPSILLILTDDQGWATLGCYGGQIVPTPHLDKLAAQGARFSDAYVTSQCMPTRATLLTGQYTARHGLWHVLSWYGYPLYDLMLGLTPCASMRQGDYKLLEFFGDRVDETGRYRTGHRSELYDLCNDIGETENLAETRPRLTSKLQQRLRRWMADMNAVASKENSHHQPPRAFLETRDKPNWLQLQD